MPEDCGARVGLRRPNCCFCGDTRRVGLGYAIVDRFVGERKMCIGGCEIETLQDHDECCLA